MTRRAARTDANQQDIIDALRKAGATVQDASGIGKGFPDLVVGKGKETFLVEVKDGSKPPSKRKLTPDQEEWHAAWRGHVCVVKNVEEALGVIGVKI